MYNSYLPQGYFAQRTEVVRVNGRNGAEAYMLAPNSSALLLDESGMLVWLVTSDGAGYKTVCPYDIIPHKDPRGGDVDERLKRLEEIVNGYSADITAIKSKLDVAD